MLNLTTHHTSGDFILFRFQPVTPTGRPIPNQPEVYMVVDASKNGRVVSMHPWCETRTAVLVQQGMLEEEEGGTLRLRSVSPDTPPARRRLWGDIARSAPHDCGRLQPGQAQEAEFYTPEGVWTGTAARVCPWCRGLVDPE